MEIENARKKLAQYNEALLRCGPLMPRQSKDALLKLSSYCSNRAFKADILPPVDQNYLEQLADRYSHLRTVITRIASQSVAKGWEYHAVGDAGDKEERREGGGGGHSR